MRESELTVRHFQRARFTAIVLVSMGAVGVLAPVGVVEADDIGV